MQTVIFSGENLKQGAVIALRARLYVPVNTYTMKAWYLGIINEYYFNYEKIVIVFDGDKPVAAGIKSKFKFDVIGTYVKPVYRRKGIGTEVLRTLVGKNKFAWERGLKGSREFYQKFTDSQKQLV